MQIIKVAARDSSLSLAQVDEVYKQVHLVDPMVSFSLTCLKTTGDLDLQSSLLEKEKTDFFTKEIDELVAKGYCDIGIHSAKDLPEPLHPKLEILALTKGVDPADVLVLRNNATLESLPHGALIGTSSLRRIEQMQKLRKDFVAKDIRGTIERRLDLLHQGIVDGVIMAKAALIRLGLLDLNWIKMPGQSAPLQGKLAIVSCKGRSDLKKIFSSLDAR